MNLSPFLQSSFDGTEILLLRFRDMPTIQKCSNSSPASHTDAEVCAIRHDHGCYGSHRRARDTFFPQREPCISTRPRNNPANLIFEVINSQVTAIAVLVGGLNDFLPIEVFSVQAHGKTVRHRV